MTEKDDVEKLGEVSGQLTTIDVDDATSQRMAQRARQGIGRGPSPRRFLEPILVAVLATSILVWALYKVLAMYR